MSITIEGIPCDVVARQKERIEEIDAQIASLTAERTTLVRIVQQIDGEMLEEQSVAAAVSAALDEGLEAEDLPANDDEPERAAPEYAGPKCTANWPPKRLRSIVARVLELTPGATLARIHDGVNEQSNTGCPLARVKAAVLAGVAEGEFERREGPLGEVFCLAPAEAEPG